VRVSDLDFVLPPDRIALRPAAPRDTSKLLVVGSGFEDHVFHELPKLLRRGDVLVFNNTKVIPSALSGVRVGRLGTTPKIEVLLHQRTSADVWKAFAKPAKKLNDGDQLQFGSLTASVAEKGDQGEITLAFSETGAALDEAIAREGRMPLPPYIQSKRDVDVHDAQDYQTMFAEKSGAVAAPTASFHFTPQVMKALQAHEIECEFVTLHVGAGTFVPIKSETTEEHRMHSEWAEISESATQRLAAAKSEGRRIIPVGTTALRVLETAQLKPFTGLTDIFITPGYKFGVADGLITNFHLPKSTLFALVSAFAGLDRMKAAYAHAIAHEYRFYSYGDASLLWPQS
jgi:S-adenosylmethionine:tRNA ribosyltransferase-isomerase